MSWDVGIGIGMGMGWDALGCECFKRKRSRNALVGSHSNWMYDIASGILIRITLVWNIQIIVLYLFLYTTAATNTTTHLSSSRFYTFYFITTRCLIDPQLSYNKWLSSRHHLFFLLSYVSFSCFFLYNFKMAHFDSLIADFFFEKDTFSEFWLKMAAEAL